MIRSIRLTLAAALLLSVTPLTALAEAPDRRELQALSYYLQQNDTAATQAELQRLRLKYPHWSPPSDLNQLSVTAPSQEIDRFYRQIAAGQFDAARATLAQTRQAFPDWQPPAEMTSLLAVSEGQIQLDEALKADDLKRATDIAARTPELLRCDRINNAWRLAEAQGKVGRLSQAYGIYQSIAGTCTNATELLATLEKADAVSTTDQLHELFLTVKQRQPAEAARLDQLLNRLLAGRGLAVAGTTVPEAVAPAPVARPPAVKAEPPVRAPAAPRQPPAQPQAAPSGGGGGGGAGGSRRVLQAKERGDWAGCLTASAGSRSVQDQYQRGWCAFNMNRPMEAVDSFRFALNGRINATERRDAHYGLALSYLKMGMTEQASRIAAAVDFTRSQRLDIERQILDQRGVAAYRSRNYHQAIRYFDALEALGGGISRNLAMLRAWSYLNIGKANRARDEFTRLHNELASHETARGIEASAN